MTRVGSQRHRQKKTVGKYTYVVRVVGIATGYGLDGSGIEPRLGGGGEIFRTCPDRPWGSPSLM